MRLAGLLLVVAVATSSAACGGDDARPDLVFVSARDGAYSIFEMNADGAAQQPLTEADPDPSTPEGLFFQIEPAWSPDSRAIAFASARSGSFDVYVMDADGTGTRRLTRSVGDERHPTWSPDGSRIAFADKDDLFVTNVSGRGVRRVSPTPAVESEPVWSRDGAWLAYTRRIRGTNASEIWMSHPDGSQARPITSLGAKSVNPAWSPDGARIAFSSNLRGPLYDIYVVGVGERRLRRLTLAGSSAFEPAWSPDGSKIAFTQDGSIRTVDLERVVEELTSPRNNDSYPAWNPQPPAGEE